MEWIVIYLCAISVLGVVITVYDKRAARKKRQRISERSLFTVAALGGATAMYAAMQIVRHKTRRNSFILVFPFLMIIHFAIVIAISYFIA